MTQVLQAAVVVSSFNGINEWIHRYNEYIDRVLIVARYWVQLRASVSVIIVYSLTVVLLAITVSMDCPRPDHLLLVRPDDAGLQHGVKYHVYLQVSK